jgi:hypothetical protein
MRDTPIPTVAEALAPALTTLGPSAHTQVIIDETLAAHQVLTVGATLWPFKPGAFTSVPVPQTGSVLLPLPGVHALASLPVLFAPRQRPILRRKLGRNVLAALLGVAIAGSAGAQASFTTQAYFAGSLHTRTIDAGSSVGDVFHEEWDPPPPTPPGEEPPPWPFDSGYRFDGEAHASGGFVAGSPVFKLDATFRGTHLSFGKAPDIPFGSTPTAQARVTLHDSIVPFDATQPFGAPVTFKLKFALAGSIDPGPLCGGPCVALDYAHSVGGLTATAQTAGFYDFRGFGAGASLWEPELPGLNGVAQDFELNFYAHVSANAFEAQLLGLLDHPGYYNSDGSIDFSHTVRLTGISGSDAQGALLQGFRLTSADGFAYAAAVPEPATAAMLLAGVAGLAWWVGPRAAWSAWRRRARQQAPHLG